MEPCLGLARSLGYTFRFVVQYKVARIIYVTMEELQI